MGVPGRRELQIIDGNSGCWAPALGGVARRGDGGPSTTIDPAARRAISQLNAGHPCSFSIPAPTLHTPRCVVRDALTADSVSAIPPVAVENCSPQTPQRPTPMNRCRPTSTTASAIGIPAASMLSRARAVLVSTFTALIIDLRSRDGGAARGGLVVEVDVVCQLLPAFLFRVACGVLLGLPLCCRYGFLADFLTPLCDLAKDLLERVEMIAY